LLLAFAGSQPLSAFKSQEISDILKHDTPFVIYLFPVSNCTLGSTSFVQKKLGFKARVSCDSHVSTTSLTELLISYVVNADSGRYADALTKGKGRECHTP